MLSVTLMVIHMSCLILSPISFEVQLPFAMQIIQCGSHMDVHSCSDPLLDVNYVSYGRTALPLGEMYRNSTSCIHLRRLSMMCIKVLNVNLHLTGGLQLS